MGLVADKMFVKLARWLRLFGISIEGVKEIEDDRLIRSVRAKNAILITADMQLAQRSRRRKFKVLLVREKDLDHQLAFVIRSLKLRIEDEPAKICPICNSKLVRISREEARGKVPNETFSRSRYFYVCRKCNNVYWHGTHWDYINRRRKRVERILKSRLDSPLLHRLP